MKKVAARYAKALFQLAKTATEKEQHYKDLAKINTWMLGSSNFAMLIENPIIPRELSKTIISKICTQGKASKHLTNFLLFIVEEGRLRALPHIIEAYTHFYHNDNNIGKADVETAHALTKDIEKSFKDILENRFKTKLIFNFKVNKNLLGGFRVQVGSHQIDSSLMTQLANLSRTLKGSS